MTISFLGKKCHVGFLSDFLSWLNVFSSHLRKMKLPQGKCLLIFCLSLIFWHTTQNHLVTVLGKCQLAVTTHSLAREPWTSVIHTSAIKHSAVCLWFLITPNRLVISHCFTRVKRSQAILSYRSSPFQYLVPLGFFLIVSSVTEKQTVLLKLSKHGLVFRMGVMAPCDHL